MKRALAILLLLIAPPATSQVTTTNWRTFTFRNVGSDSDTLYQNPVRFIELDDNDTLWAGLATGLVKRTADNSFYHYLTPDSSRVQNVLNDVRGLTKDGSGNLWVATGAGLMELVSGKWGFESDTSIVFSDTTLADSSLFKVRADTSGALYFGLRYQGLYYYSP